MHPAAALLAIQLLHIGQYHPDEIHTVSGDRWMALVDKGKSTTLRKVTIHIKRVEDVDDEPGEKSAKEVSITPAIKETSVIALVRGLDLREGAVPTAEFKGDGDIGKPLQVKLPDAQTHYTLSMTCKSADHCPLVLSANGQRQQLVVLTRDGDVPDFKGLRIIWAGDLDGDGKLDLIVDITNHYNASGTALFLSSKAKRGELVGLAAKFLTVGC
jgi:hypothetical protein